MFDNNANMNEAVRHDYHALLAMLLEYTGIAALHGSVFWPFGAFLDRVGSLSLAMAQLDDDATWLDYVDSLLLGFRGQAYRGEIRAVGCVLSGSKTLPSGRRQDSTIQYFLEHETGHAVRVDVAMCWDQDSKPRPAVLAVERDQSRVFLLRQEGPHSVELQSED